MQAAARAGVVALTPSSAIEFRTTWTNGTKHMANGAHSFKKRGTARDNAQDGIESLPAALFALSFRKRSENVSDAAREMRMKSAGIGTQRTRWSSSAALSTAVFWRRRMGSTTR